MRSCFGVLANVPAMESQEAPHGLAMTAIVLVVKDQGKGSE
jgi:hypothetical protein